MSAEPKSWAVIVPVKRLAVAKTRLALPAPHRAAVALAMAEDTIRACLAAPVVRRVVVVTDDADGALLGTALGAHVVPDLPDAGLNPALRHGAETAAAADPFVHLATVAADLPALRGNDLATVLRAAAAHRQALVADAAGTGTVLYAATDLAAFTPAFGALSRQAHVAAGAFDLTDVAAAALRRDVDTLADLTEAGSLGWGAATRLAVGAVSLT